MNLNQGDTNIMMDAYMMQSVEFWVSLTLLQSKACIGGLDGCGQGKGWLIGKDLEWF